MAPSRTRRLLVLFAAVVTLGALGGLTTDPGAVSTMLGVLTGAAAVLLVAVAVALLLDRRRRREQHDRTTLDALEPLRGNGSGC